MRFCKKPKSQNIATFQIHLCWIGQHSNSEPSLSSSRHKFSLSLRHCSLVSLLHRLLPNIRSSCVLSCHSSCMYLGTFLDSTCLSLNSFLSQFACPFLCSCLRAFLCPCLFLSPCLSGLLCERNQRIGSCRSMSLKPLRAFRY